MLHPTRFNFLFALIARPSLLAHAFIRTDAIDTFAAVQTWFIFAVVDVGLAVGARESFTTFAREFIVQIQAAFGANRVARINQAFVDFGFALQSNEPWSAFADKSIDFIDAGGSVLAWLALTIVDGVLTIFAGVAWLTVAGVSIDQVDAAAIIRAWIFGTIIDVNVALVASPTRIANAFIIE